MAHDGTATTEAAAPSSTPALVVHTPTAASSIDSSMPLENITNTVDASSLFRLFLGAFLSMTDMATDLVSIANFLRDSRDGFARSLIAILIINMVVQLIIVFLQHRKKGARTLLVEALLTVTCVSPGVHAYRVARGHERQSKESMAPKYVLIASKCGELCFEAVPGLILQLYAFLTLPTSSSFALVSISTSASTIAFNVSVMYYEKDTDAYNRDVLNPLFYGVFPADSTSRSLAFFCLIVFSLAHAFSKSLSVALLWATFGGPAVLGYYGCELGVFFTVKFLRRDLVYWMPVHGLLSNVVLACVSRFTAKVLLDFTGLPQTRHPYEAGGINYTLSLVWSQISAVIFAVLYQKYYTGVDEDGVKRRDKISATAVYGIVGAVVFVWLVSFAAFIKLINKEYLHTFFGTMTGPQYAINTTFRTGTNDITKMEIFRLNELYWTSIRHEVKDYMHGNWERWNKERPEWFTEELIASIPDEFIPRVQEDRERSSAFLLALGVADGNATGSRGEISSKVAPAVADSGRVSGTET